MNYRTFFIDHPDSIREAITDMGEAERDLMGTMLDQGDELAFCHLFLKKLEDYKSDAEKTWESDANVEEVSHGLRT